MAKANPFDPSDLALSDVRYMVSTAGDQLYIPGNNGRGDNPNSGTMAQRLAANNVMRSSDGTNPLGQEQVV